MPKSITVKAAGLPSFKPRSIGILHGKIPRYVCMRWCVSWRGGGGGVEGRRDTWGGGGGVGWGRKRETGELYVIAWQRSCFERARWVSRGNSGLSRGLFWICKSLHTIAVIKISHKITFPHKQGGREGD